MLRGIALAIVTILLHLRRALAIGRIERHVDATRLRRLWLRLRHALWWIDHHVILAVIHVLVVGACCEEEHRAADPHAGRIVRQLTGANTVGRCDHYVARTLRAIPVAAGVEEILATIRHAVLLPREAINGVARTILRAWPPAVTATGPTRPTAIVAATRAVVAPWPLVVAADRRLSLPYHAWLALDGRAILPTWLRRRHLGTMALLLLNTLGLALIEFLLALLPLGLLLLLLLTPLLLLLLTAQFALLLLHLLLHLLLLATLLLLLVALLLLHALLHLLLHLLTALLLLGSAVLPAPFRAILRTTLIIVVGQGLSAHAQAQQTNASQAPDGRIHGFLTG